MTSRLRKSSKKVRGRYAKYFVFWVIQDFNMCPQRFGMMIRSPPFVVGLLGGTKWSLIFYPRGDSSPSPERDFMAFYLQREEHSNKIDSVLVDFELRFITLETEYGEVKRRKSFQNIHFKELDRHGEQKFFKIKQRSLGNMEIFEDDEIESVTERRRKPRIPEVRKRKPRAVKEDVFSRTEIKLECSIIFKEYREITSKNNNREMVLLSSDLRRMYNLKYFVDLEIACGNQVFSVHRAILSVRCPKLLKCLAFENREEIPQRARLFSVPNKVFRCLLVYIYTGRLKAPLYNIRSKLYEFAYSLEMEDLIRLLDNFPDSSKFTTTFQTGQYKMALEIGWSSRNTVTSITRVFPSDFKCFKRLVMSCEIKYLKTDIKEKSDLAESDLTKSDIAKSDPPKKMARHIYSLSFCFYITGLEEYEHLVVLRSKIYLKKSKYDVTFKVVDRRYSFRCDGSWRGNDKVSTKIYVEEEMLPTDSKSKASEIPVHQKLAMKCDIIISDVTYHSEAENMVQDIFLPCKLFNLGYYDDANVVAVVRDEPGKGAAEDIAGIWGDAKSNDNAASNYISSALEDTESNDNAASDNISSTLEDTESNDNDSPDYISSAWEDTESNDNAAPEYMLPAEDATVDIATLHFGDGAASDEDDAGVVDDMPLHNFKRDCDVDALEGDVDKEADSTAAGQGDEEAAATAIGEGDVDEAAVTAAGEGDDETASTATGEAVSTATGEAVSTATGESDDEDEETAFTAAEEDDVEKETAAIVAGEGDDKETTAFNADGNGDYVEDNAATTGDDKEAAYSAAGESDDKEAVSIAAGEGDADEATSDAEGAVATQRRNRRVDTLIKSIRKRYKYSRLQLSTDLLALKDSGAYNDFSVLSEERHVFNVHKAILGLRSKYFRRKFSENTANYTRYEFEDLSPTTTELLLSYLYSGVVGDLSDDERIELRKAADKYGIGYLKNKCDSFLE